MLSTTVPHQEDMAAEVLEQVAEKVNYIGCLDVLALVKPSIQGDPAPFRRQAQS
jgi:hypothetical protein